MKVPAFQPLNLAGAKRSGVHSLGLDTHHGAGTYGLRVRASLVSESSELDTHHGEGS